MNDVPVTLADLMRTLPQQGVVQWIGLRPERAAALVTPLSVEGSATQGLSGDRYQGRSGQRQVTLVQWEHLQVIACLLDRIAIDPAVLRRNLAISGINLLALKNRFFRIGQLVLQHTGACQPCSRMERALGPGGYNAVRGHGGITARIIEGGVLSVGDPVTVLDSYPLNTTEPESRV